MNIEWNKVTWYSKILAVIVFLLTFYVGFVLGQKTSEISEIYVYPTNPVNNSYNLSQTYSNSAKGFSIKYPTGFIVGEAYKYEELGPGKEINGVEFGISKSIATGTNLSSDSYISVEQISGTQSCTADLFLDQVKAQILKEGNTTYSFASSIGAGAGNRYEETVYAIPGTSPCTAVRYFVHYSVFENYPPGSVNQFDKQALLKQFDAIRHTLVITK